MTLLACFGCCGSLAPNRKDSTAFFVGGIHDHSARKTQRTDRCPLPGPVGNFGAATYHDERSKSALQEIRCTEDLATPRSCDETLGHCSRSCEGNILHRLIKGPSATTSALDSTSTSPCSQSEETGGGAELTVLGRIPSASSSSVSAFSSTAACLQNHQLHQLAAATARRLPPPIRAPAAASPGDDGIAAVPIIGTGSHGSAFVKPLPEACGLGLSASSVEVAGVGSANATDLLMVPEDPSPCLPQQQELMPCPSSPYY